MKQPRHLTHGRKLEALRLGDLHVAPQNQREFRPYHAKDILSKFDLEDFKSPEVNLRGGRYYIMDGQHGVWALKQWLGDGWEDVLVDCWVWRGLSEEAEASHFVRTNTHLRVSTFDAFRVKLQDPESFPEPTAISRLVQEAGLRISKHKIPGAIYAVGTLVKIYRRDGAACLRSALSTARDAYGDPGLTNLIFDGLGLFFARYEEMIRPPEVVKALQSNHGGVNGLTGIAEELRLKTGNSKNQCIAATVVTMVNRKRRGAARLAGWWK